MRARVQSTVRVVAESMSRECTTKESEAGERKLNHCKTREL